MKFVSYRLFCVSVRVICSSSLNWDVPLINLVLKGLFKASIFGVDVIYSSQWSLILPTPEQPLWLKEI